MKEKVGVLSDFEEGKLKGVVAGTCYIVIGMVEGRLYAIDGRCTHQNGDLALGKQKGRCVSCRMHRGEFDLITGERTGGMPTKGLKTYPVEVVGDEVFVDI